MFKAFLTALFLSNVVVGCGYFDEFGFGKKKDVDEALIDPIPGKKNDEDLKVLYLEDQSKLPECNSDKEGILSFIKDQRQFYICENGNWTSLDVKGDTGETGTTGDKGDKGDKGDQGIAGFDGDDGLNGSDGSDGSNGVNGSDGTDGADGTDNHIATHWECSITMSDNPYLTLNETVEYTVDLTTYGDVIAWMRMTNNQLDFTKTRSYPKTHADAATAKVTYKMNIVGGSVNMGLLQVTMNQSTDEATILFTDADQASLGGVYTKTASCAKTTY